MSRDDLPWLLSHWPHAPHEPVLWRRRARPGSRAQFAHFGYYTARSMAKWIALKGHAYDVILANGQLVSIFGKKPKTTT